jgi:hypothetical protein
VANGGTGATTLTGYIKGTGTTAMTASANIPVADVTGAAPLASPTFTGTVTTAAINTGALSATSVTSPIYASTPQTLTDDATISWNPTIGLNANVTLGGNRTLSFSTTPASGSYGTLVVTQDGIGGRTLTLPSGTHKVLGSATGSISLSATAGAKDILNFYYDGLTSTYYWNVGQGYGAASTFTANNIAGGAAGSIPYQTASGATSLLAKGSDGYILTLASGIPSWAAAPATGVTSVAMSTPTGLSVSGSPITSSGTLALSLTTGYAIPLSSSQTNWDAAYTNRITSASSPLSITSNAISLGTVPVSSGGTGQTSIAGIKSSLGLTSTKVAIGSDAGQTSQADYSVAVGDRAGNSTQGGYSVAVGIGAGQTSQGIGSIAIGSAAAQTNQGGSSIAIGSNAAQNGQGTQSVAVGNAANSGGNNATSIGAYSSAGANNSIAIGYYASSGTYSSTAIGGYASAGYANSTAIGYQAFSSAANTIQLGADGVSVVGSTAVTNVKTSGTLTLKDVTYPNTHGSANQVLSTTGSGTLTWATVSGPTDASTTAKGIIQLAGDLRGTATSPTVNTVGGVNSSTISTINTTVSAATNSNTVSTIVKRDASGNFSAGTITANLTGNVTGSLTGNATTATTAGNVTGTVAVANGGTGLTSTPLNGQVDIGNGSGFTRATLTAGTAITITNTAGTITIAAAVRPMTDQTIATSSHAVATATFTLANTPLNAKVWMFINGVRTNNNAYTVSGTTVTYTAANNNSYTIVVGDRIQFDYAY